MRSHSIQAAMIATLFSLCVFMWVQKPVVLNAQENDECRGVDLVVLIDQSNSMENNDPEELRVNAARLFVNSLGNNILYDCSEEIHRLAVVGFGDVRGGAIDTQTYLQVEIAPKLDEFDEWRKLRDEHTAKIPQPVESLGGTDFLSAFQQAESILDQWAISPIGNTNRLRGVVMIADGGPCVIDLGCGGTGMSWQNYLAQMRQYLARDGEAFPFRGDNNATSVRIWFIGFNDTQAAPGYDYLSPNGDYGSALRDFWQEVSESHGGSFAVLDSSGNQTRNRDVSLKVAEIIDVVTGSVLTPTTCQEPFYIDPYTERMLIRILKIGSNPNVEIEDVRVDLVYQGPKEADRFSEGSSNGNAGRVADHQPDGPNEFYIIERPAPGEWRIETEGASECRDLDVRYNTYDLTVDMSIPKEVLPQFDEAPFYDPDAPQRMELTLLSGESKDTILSDTDYPIVVNANVKPPNGSVQPFTLVQNRSGEWQSDTPLQLREAGIYKWDVLATAPDGQRKGRIQLVSRSGIFTVRSVRRFGIQIVSPQEGDRIILNQYEAKGMSFAPIPLAVQVIDAVSGEVISAGQISSGSSTGLLSVQVESQGRVSNPIPMSYDSGVEGWTAIIEPGSEGVPISIEPLEMIVRLDESSYDAESFRPDPVEGRITRIQIDRSLTLAGSVVEPLSSRVIPQEETEPFFDQQAPVYFAYRVIGYDQTDGRLRESLPPGRLSAEATISLDGGLIQTLPLGYDTSSGLWRADKPLDVREDGQYTWQIDIFASGDQYKEIVTPLADTGNFTVSRIGRFHAEIVSPSNGQVYPLNRIESGQTQDILLPVEVKIVDDETGESLTDAELRTDVDASKVVSVSVEATASTSQPVALRYVASTRSWRGSLESGQGETPDETGVQTLRVFVNVDAFDRNKYRPSLTDTARGVVTFERVMIRPVEIEPSVPLLTSALYSGSRYCLNAQPIPLHFDLLLVSSSGAQRSVLDPSIIARDPSMLAKVELMDPVSLAVLETGQIELVQSNADTAMRITIGTDYKEAGNYQIRITPVADALQAGYEFLRPDQPIIVQVERYTDWRYEPGTCQIVRASGIGILSMILLWMIFCFVQRPIGLLEIFDDDGRNSMAEFRLGRGFFFRPRQVIKWKGDPSISKIVVTRGNSDYVAPTIYNQENETGTRRAIEVRIYDDSGADLGTWTLGSGDQPTRITIDSQFKYT